MKFRTCANKSQPNKIKLLSLLHSGFTYTPKCGINDWGQVLNRTPGAGQSCVSAVGLSIYLLVKPWAKPHFTDNTDLHACKIKRHFECFLQLLWGLLALASRRWLLYWERFAEAIMGSSMFSPENSVKCERCSASCLCCRDASSRDS